MDGPLPVFLMEKEGLLYYGKKRLQKVRKKGWMTKKESPFHSMLHVLGP
jgi:hypothetical protein